MTIVDSSIPRTIASEDQSTSTSQTTVHGAAVDEATRSTKASSFLKFFNHVLRRTHLYAGLLLLPWVFLYGVTGFLFNHATFFPDTKIVEFEKSATNGTSLASIPNASSIADQLVQQLNAQGAESYKLIKPESARFDRGGLSASVKDGSGTSYNVILNSEGGGTIRENRTPASREKVEAPFAARRGLELKESPLPGLEKGLPAVLAKVGLEKPIVEEVRMAPLSFQMEGGGKVWQVSYNAQMGSLSGKELAANQTPDLSARSFLLRLHTTHHYPGEFNFRWIWAVIVDVMSLLMVFWGVSGIVMWWQIKRTRWIGAVLLGVSMIAAIWIGIGMHELLSSGVR